MTTYSLSLCEKGHIGYEGDNSWPARSQPNRVASRSLVTGTIVIILLNLCLLLFGYFVFGYVNTLENGKKKSEILSGFCSLSGVVIIICMILSGDMSKNNPYFYYI